MSLGMRMEGVFLFALCQVLWFAGNALLLCYWCFQSDLSRTSLEVLHLTGEKRFTKTQVCNLRAIPIKMTLWEVLGGRPWT